LIGGVGLVVRETAVGHVPEKSSLGGNDASAAAMKVLPKAVKDGGDDVSSLSSTNSNSIRVGEDEDAFALRIEDSAVRKAEHYGIRVVWRSKATRSATACRSVTNSVRDDKPILPTRRWKMCQQSAGEPGTLVSLSLAGWNRGVQTG
jgi:hypothetical protein